MFAPKSYALKSFSVIISLVYVVCVTGASDKYLLEKRYIEMPVNHFETAEEKFTFQLRYLVNEKHWVMGGPMFVYIGSHEDIWTQAQTLGFFFEIAPTYQAVLVFIEHRYYGESLPFGNHSFDSIENLQYLSTRQALADFAHLIDMLSKRLTLESSRIIAFGGSYGGAMASWLKIKYPFLIRGSIGSSTPFFEKPELLRCEAVYEKVTSIFKEQGSEECVQTIKKGWDLFKSAANTTLGMTLISSVMKLCKNLEYKEDVDQMFDWLSNVYVTLAMNNYDYSSDFGEQILPGMPLKWFCDKLDSYNQKDLRTLMEGFGDSLQIVTNFTKTRTCNNIYTKNEDLTKKAWDYQSCTEMIRPICSVETDMFINKPWDFEKFKSDCKEKYKFQQRPDGPVITPYNKNFQYFSNSILFTNPMMDPYSDLENYFNMTKSVIFFNISGGLHLNDFRHSHSLDNKFIIEAKDFILNIINKWLNINEISMKN